MINNFDSLTKILHWRAENQGDKLAFEFIKGDEENGACISYSELSNQAKSISVGLQSHVDQETRVLILLPPGLNLIASFFGVLYSKSIAVLIPPPVSEKGLGFFYKILEDLSPDAIVTSEHYFSKVNNYLTKKSFNKNIPLLTIEALLNSDSDSWIMPTELSSAPCLIQYTSGSVNHPKGVIITNKNLIHNSTVIQQSFFHTTKSRGLIWLPPYHDMGLIGGIIQPVFAGFPTTLMAPITFIQKPFRWLNLITKKGITTSGGPNFAYDLCIQKITEEEKENLDLESWQVAFNGAEPVSPKIIRKFSQYFGNNNFRFKSFLTCYGLAESTLYVSGSLNLDAPTIIKAERSNLQNNQFVKANEDSTDYMEIVSSGLPFYGEEIKIVDPETNKICQKKEVGEIWLHSESVAQGYWNNKEATTNTFHAKLHPPDAFNYLRTGDLGFIYRNELYIAGRLKEMVIIRGINYYPQDIENTVQNCNIKLAKDKGAVFALPHNEGERLVIINEVDRQYLKTLDTEAIISEIRVAIFQKHQINPSAVILVKPGQIPRTPNGKIQRTKCIALFLNNEFKELGRWINESAYAPSPIATNTSTSKSQNKTVVNNEYALDADNIDDLREQLSNWLRLAIALEVDMDPEELDTDMHFGLYGLDSVSAVSIITNLENQLEGIKIEETFLWDYPNISAASEFLSEQYLEHI